MFCILLEFDFRLGTQENQYFSNGLRNHKLSWVAKSFQESIFRPVYHYNSSKALADDSILNYSISYGTCLLFKIGQTNSFFAQLIWKNQLLVKSISKFLLNFLDLSFFKGIVFRRRSHSIKETKVLALEQPSADKRAINDGSLAHQRH